jgi:HEAT repeat protein
MGATILPPILIAVVEMAARTLLYLARDAESGVMIIASGAVPPLIQLLGSGSPGIRAAAATALMILGHSDGVKAVEMAADEEMKRLGMDS